MGVVPGALRGGGVAGGAEDGGEAGDDAAWRTAIRVERVGWAEELVRGDDCFTVSVVVCARESPPLVP